MKERLIIRNFGPIKSIELELGRFNILIGEQATGKSTVAKVLAVCRYFSYIVWNEKAPSAFEIGLNSWGLSEFVQDDSFIEYECVNYSVIVECRMIATIGGYPDKEGFVEIEFPSFTVKLVPKSLEFKSLIAELEKLGISSKDGSPYSSPSLMVPTSFFQNDVARVMDNPFYLPAERGLQSVFSLGKNSIQNISDSLFNQFAQLDQIARQFGLETDIEPLGIIYKNEQGKGFIKKKGEEEFFSLFNAASGYQSTIPVVLLIRYYNEIRKKKKTFVIEEPELNLFPAAQQKLMQYVVNMTLSHGHTMLLTTHSPYILTSLNNMMYAFQVGERHKVDANRIIEEKFWINPNDVATYMLKSDGTCEDIFDREGGLIKADKIDGITSVLNEQFDALLSIELGEK